MDRQDLAIYRYLSPDGVARFWAGRRVLDPRITPREIGERVGISESAVRVRLQRLTHRGFLRDRTVVPNPALFGRSVFVVDLPVRQSGEVNRILRDLALVDGVVFTRDVMDEEERKIQTFFVAEDLAGAGRLSALLGRLTSGSPQLAPRPYHLPRCDGALSPLDWKVLACVHRVADATFAHIAGSVGISQKTAARVYNRLIDSGACWWTHGPASEEFPLALVLVSLEDASDLDRVLGWIRTEGHPWIPVARDGFGADPESSGKVLPGLAPADLPTVLERFLRGLAGVEGVAGIRRTFPLGSVIYSSWFSDRVAQQLHTLS
jgi:DNA-binding Lrp family transcriptional regulator